MASRGAAGLAGGPPAAGGRRQGAAGVGDPWGVPFLPKNGACNMENGGARDGQYGLGRLTWGCSSDGGQRGGAAGVEDGGAAPFLKNLAAGSDEVEAGLGVDERG